MHIFLIYLQLATCSDGKKMLLCTQSFKLSCHPDFNCFWHTHLRAVGRGGDITLQCELTRGAQVLPAPACAGRVPQGQQLTKMAAAADAGKDKYPAAPSCLLFLVLTAIAVCPTESLCGSHNPLPPRPEYGERLGCSQPHLPYLCVMERKSLDGDRLFRVILL